MRFFAPPDAIRDGHADYIAEKEGIMFDYLEVIFDHQFELPKLGKLGQVSSGKWSQFSSGSDFHESGKNID